MMTAVEYSMHSPTQVDIFMPSLFKYQVLRGSHSRTTWRHHSSNAYFWLLQAALHQHATPHASSLPHKAPRKFPPRLHCILYSTHRTRPCWSKYPGPDAWTRLCCLHRRTRLPSKTSDQCMQIISGFMIIVPNFVHGNIQQLIHYLYQTGQTDTSARDLTNDVVYPFHCMDSWKSDQDVVSLRGFAHDSPGIGTTGQFVSCKVFQATHKRCMHH